MARPPLAVRASSARERFCRSTIGASGDVSSLASRSLTSHSRRTASSDGNINANGFSSRAFARRSRSTASPLRASTTR